MGVSRLRRSFVKLCTGLVTAYLMSKGSSIKAYLVVDHSASLLMRAALALGATVVMARVAKRRRSNPPRKELSTPRVDIKNLPSEAELAMHLHTYNTNLARALELKRAHGDLSRDEAQVLARKFDDMRETIRMTEDLLAYVRS